MHLQRIVVATDASDAGRAAVRTGMLLAEASGAELRVMTVALVAPSAVAAASATWAEGLDSVEALGRHVSWSLGSSEPPTSLELDLVAGLPGIEVPRHAEEHGADLVILGRKQRSQATRLVMGDTADAVARRSRVPCLIVPPGPPALGSILAAVDGTLRGECVVDTACQLACAAGARLGVVTVEPRHEGPDDLAAQVPGARAERVQSAARATGARCGIGVEVLVRRGDPATEIIAALPGWDVLAVGYHRGGPPGIIEAGSVARRLAHTVSVALLTVPL